MSSGATPLTRGRSPASTPSLPTLMVSVRTRLVILSGVEKVFVEESDGLK